MSENVARKRVWPLFLGPHPKVVLSPLCRVGLEAHPMSCMPSSVPALAQCAEGTTSWNLQASSRIRRHIPI